MAQLDRTDGLVGNAAVKYPCRMASTAVLVLSGLQTIDGVVGAQDDRVLVKDNASVANGIYVMDSGDWERAQDADNDGAFTEGSLVKVNQGTQAGFWYVTNTGTITPDSTVITFTRASTVLATIGLFWQAILVLTTTLASRQALLLDKHGADVPAVAALNLDTSTGDLVDVTGNTGITSIVLSEGVEKTVRFTGTPLISNGASLILPGSADIKAAAGDYAVFRGYAAGVVRCVEYNRLSQHGADVASAATIDLTGASGDLIDVTGAVTITAITLAEGRSAVVRFTGALTLTNGASLVLPGAANIVTAAGDFAIFRGYAGGVVRCVSYVKASGAPVTMSPITASLGADVNLNNTANYFDGPSIAQGAVGTWFVVAKACFRDSAGASFFLAKLWDGTTVIDSAEFASAAANAEMSATLCGFISAPVGNLRLSGRDVTSTNGKMFFNATGLSKDSTITAIRIA